MLGRFAHIEHVRAFIEASSVSALMQPPIFLTLSGPFGVDQREVCGTIDLPSFPRRIVATIPQTRISFLPAHPGIEMPGRVRDR